MLISHDVSFIKPVQ